MPLGASEGKAGFAVAFWYSFEGFLGDKDDHGQDEDAHGEGTGEDGFTEANDCYEEGEAEHSEDDGGDAGEIADIDLDESNEAVLSISKFFEIDCGGDSDGDDENNCEGHDVHGADERAPDSGFVGKHLAWVGFDEFEADSSNAIHDDFVNEGAEDSNSDKCSEEADALKNQVAAFALLGVGGRIQECGGAHDLASPRHFSDVMLGDEIEGKCNEEEDKADSEDGLVADIASGYIAFRNVDDLSGHGHDFVSGVESELGGCSSGDCDGHGFTDGS